jgi:hypothetical protein
MAQSKKIILFATILAIFIIGFSAIKRRDHNRLIDKITKPASVNELLMNKKRLKK